MRIRSQLKVFAAAAVVLGAAMVAIVVAAAREEDRTSDLQTRAQATLHAVTGLLVLTQEYARHSEPRAGEQWHLRQAAIAATLGEPGVRAVESPALAELRAVALALPPLFTRLQEVAGQEDAFALRRKEVLLDQLLTNAQSMTDYAQQWYQDTSRVRREAERRFQIAALATPAALLVLLGLLILIVRQRVLAPLARLEQATHAVAAGDLEVRVGSNASDELGDLSRYFDHMTHALAARGQELRQSEQKLRAIADNLPVLISHFDRDEIFQFANAHHQTQFGVDPAALVGQSLSAHLGPHAYLSARPEIARVLAGERRHYERDSFGPGRDRHAVVDFIPEFDAAGVVVGFYALVADITERRNAELAQARSERLLRLMADNLPTLIAYVDRDEIFRFANAHYRSVLGVAPQDLLGRSMAQGLGPEAYALVQPYFARALTGERQRFERTNTFLGRRVHLLTDYIPDIDDHGRVAGVFAMAVDITQLKDVQHHLEASEQRLRAVTNHIPAMVGHFDAQERCLFANTTVLALQGLREDQALGLSLRAGIGEEAYALHAPHVKNVLQGAPAQFDGQIRRQGRDVHFQAHLVPDRADGGAVQGFYLMSFDTTAARRAEERLQRIADNLPVLITYLDRDLRLRFVNETYRSWLGVEPHSLLGKFSREVFGAKLFEMRRPYLERTLAGERVDFEDEATVNGVLRCTRVSYIPDVDAQGDVRGIYALTTDITQLKLAEREMRKLARVDTLTGLPNRLQFNEKLPEALARAERSGDALALMFLDIDYFKSINDSLGHAAGDAVLKEFAQRLAGAVRVTDTVARLAGDEFVVILEGLHSENEPRAVADKIVAQVCQPMQVLGQRLDVTTSVGVAYHGRAAGGATASRLLAKADEALYQAKGAGRNRYHFLLSEEAAQ